MRIHYNKRALDAPCFNAATVPSQAIACDKKMRKAPVTKSIVVSVHNNSYKDSICLLEATRTLLEYPGVAWGWAFMATPANLETLAKAGFTEDPLRADANDLVLAVRATDESAAAAALEAASRLLFNSERSSVANEPEQIFDLRSALKLHPTANIAIISTPGHYATLEAQKALTAGLHVLLFSDNVPLEDEVALKRRGRRLGRLVMGPGAGTAMLGGVGLGFANRVSAGPVGIVAASGTGAQEAMSLLDRWGVGVSHVIGVGGRDLSAEVGGIMTEMATRALDADADTQAILLISKPPSRDVVARVLELPQKPTVASLIGLTAPLKGHPQHVTICDTLEEGASRTLAGLGMPPPDNGVGRLIEKVARAAARLNAGRKRLVGLYSGGTLCYEAMMVASRRLGPVFSNAPFDENWTIESAPPGAHICLDLGEESYTQGRPHPMIDARARAELLRRQASDPTVAAVVFDVVIGDGAHPDPASVLAPLAAEVVRSGAAVVVYVLGTMRDPQGFEEQRARFEQAGCIVADSAARAALAATALVLRDPSVARDNLPPGFSPFLKINPEKEI